MIWWQVRRLRSENPSVRLSAVNRLALTYDPRVAGPLLGCLSDSDSHVRCAAASALGRLGDQTATARLKDLLVDLEPLVRRNAAEALGRLGWEPPTQRERTIYLVALGQWSEAAWPGDSAVEALMLALNTEWNEASLAAIAEELVFIGPLSRSRLLEHLQRPESGRQAQISKIAIASALGGVDEGNPLFDVLESALCHPLTLVGDAAVMALRKAQERGQGPTSQKLKVLVAKRGGRWDDVAAIGGEEALNALLGGIGERSHPATFSELSKIAQALGRTGSNRALHGLSRLLAMGDTYGREGTSQLHAAAVQATVSIGGVEAFDTLVDAWRNSCNFYRADAYPSGPEGYQLEYQKMLREGIQSLRLQLGPQVPESVEVTWRDRATWTATV